MPLDSFNVYHSYLKAIEPLNDAECGRLLKACLIYSMTGEVPELRGNERFIFPSWQSQIDRDRDKYEARCRQNSKNISIRWNTNEYDRIRTNTKHTKDKDKDKDNITPLNPPKGGRERFAPPTVEEVREYCLSRNNGIDPEAFVAFYASKGWMIGKNRMKDWKQAVITWEKSRKPSEPKQKEAPAYRTETDPKTGEEVIVWLK